MALLCTSLGILSGHARAEDAATPPALRTVSVSGSGRVTAQPDMVVMTLGVQTSAASADVALTAKNDILARLMSVLREGGVAEPDMRVRAFRLQPRYRPGGAQLPENLTDYVASNTLEVTVRDLGRLGVLLDQVVQLPNTSVDALRFEMSSVAAMLERARELAVTEARRKAEQFATLTDAALGDVLTIRETSREPTPSLPLATPTSEEGNGVMVDVGTQVIVVNVEVTWLLR